MKTRRHL